MKLNFSFSLNSDYLKHIKEKSFYNHNYYEVDLQKYGDYIIAEKCNVLFQECIDDCTEAYYSLGYFDENDKFQAMWTWLDKWNKLK